jgi:SAM-dependent methyltransferase
MSQINSGIRSILNGPGLYSLFQNAVGGMQFRKRLTRDYFCVETGNKVLEIGCGPGVFSEFFTNDISYTGFDISQQYIDFAKTRYGSRKNLQFICSDVNDFIVSENIQYDFSFAAGLIHHLNDEEAIKVFKMAKEGLGKGKRFMSIDPVFVDGQSPIAKFFISKDRGLNIRTASDYEKLAKSEFKSVKVKILHNLLRIPYTHAIVECTSE